MKLENSIFEENYRTSFSQTGIHDCLTNKSFLSFMEDLAGAHSAYCHYSFNDIISDNLTWVLLNWKLQVFRRPKDDENINIQTWGVSRNKLFVVRDFKMTDDTGSVISIASSKWCLVDIHSKKIAKMPDNLEEIYHGFHDESVFGNDDFPKIGEPTSAPINSQTYKIRRFDLDINKHVHNLNYLNFAYELLPEDVYDGDELNNVEIVYKRELKYGDVIKSFLYLDDGVYTIVIKSEDEKIIHSIIKLYN